MDVILVDQKSFADMVTGLGGGDIRLPDGGQAVVVRISWDGPAYDGWYQLALLDARNSPARPLAALGGWDGDGVAATHTSSAYDTLSVAYEWMEGAATVRDGLGGATRLTTVGTRARAGGGLVGVFLAGLHEPEITDPSQLIGGLILIGPDDSIAWAKSLTPAT